MYKVQRKTKSNAINALNIMISYQEKDSFADSRSKNRRGIVFPSIHNAPCSYMLLPYQKVSRCKKIEGGEANVVSNSNRRNRNGESGRVEKRRRRRRDLNREANRSPRDREIHRLSSRARRTRRHGLDSRPLTTGALLE